MEQALADNRAIIEHVAEQYNITQVSTHRHDMGSIADGMRWNERRGDAMGWHGMAWHGMAWDEWDEMTRYRDGDKMHISLFPYVCG